MVRCLIPVSALALLATEDAKDVADGTGINDTICPVDFEERGQIDSDQLHRNLITPLSPSSQLHAIFDCCHSGSVLELSHVYRLDESGQVMLLDKLAKPYPLLSRG